jgi:hypothetical protein
MIPRALFIGVKLPLKTHRMRTRCPCCIDPHGQETCPSYLILLNRHLKFAFELSGQRAGFQRHDSRVTSRLYVLVSPRKPGGPASPILQRRGSYFLTRRIDNPHTGLSIFVIPGVLRLFAESTVKFARLALDDG